LGFILKEAKGKKFTIRFKLFTLIIIILLVYIFHRQILEGLGSFLIEQEYQIKNADVILFEEENLLKNSVEKCNLLYQENNCKEVWIIRLPMKQNIIPEEKINKLLKEILDSLGYKFNYRYFFFNLEHPYTYNKSSVIVDSLKKYGYNKVLILTNAFHSKRTLSVYRKLLLPYGINVFCSVYYTDYNSSDWWNSAEGVRNIVSEYLKLVYYWLKGYL